MAFLLTFPILTYACSERAYTYEQVYELAREISLKPLPTFNIPTPIAKLVAKGMDMLPYNQMISPDLIQRVSRYLYSIWVVPVTDGLLLG